MDWTGLLRDSWRVTRRTPALWGLGVISALQGGLYSLIVVGLILPMTALTQLLVTTNLAPTVEGASLSPLQAYLPGVVAWIQQWTQLLVAGIIFIIAIWAVLGVLDVAATAGLTSQVARVREGREASMGAGMRDGFAVWWRTISLLAIAALPALAYLLVLALFTLFTISIPLSQGRVPDVAAISAGNAVNGMLSTVVGIVGIPLAVLVNLGLRYVVLEGLEWREAFASAWRLARDNLGEVVIMYVIQAATALGIGLVATFLIGFVAIAAVVLVSVLVAAAHAFSGAAMFVTLIAGLVIVAALSVYSVAVLVWYSVIWTLFWRRITGREPRTAAPAYQTVAPGGAQGEVR